VAESSRGDIWPQRVQSILEGDRGHSGDIGLKSETVGSRGDRGLYRGQEAIAGTGSR
jgi:hypothetical protein